jgi:hypothetical protein
MTFNITTPFNSKPVNMGLLCFVIFACFSCKKSGTVITSPRDTAVTAVPPATVNFLTPSYNPVLLDTSKLFNPTPVTNNLFRKDLLEISGVAASKINPGILYIHNDSGNPNQVYLTDGSGADKGTLTLTPVGNRDWEDIAVGPGPDAGKSYVYVGEIGDNDSKYSSIFVYRFPEPDLSGKTLPLISSVTTLDQIQLKYPDGPRNAETLMVDPITKDIYIVSKQNNLANIYVARYPQSTSAVTVLTPVAQLYFNKATGGDISPDGTEILLRSNEVIWYWHLQPNTSISAGLITQPQHAPYINKEPQGEGICFAADGSGYYTNTEIRGYIGKLATISFYKRK